jgi:hypothetical protein
MKESPEAEGAMIVNGPEAEIKFMLQEIDRMGANDKEHSDINAVLEQLANGKLSPPEAIKAAKEIFGRKMEGAQY